MPLSRYTISCYVGPNHELYNQDGVSFCELRSVQKRFVQKNNPDSDETSASVVGFAHFFS